MNILSRGLGIVAASLLSLALCACGGGGSADGDAGINPAPPTPPPVGGTPAGTVIGPAGGTVTGPNGASVVIPPGALAADITITIEQTSAGSPRLPGGFSAAGAMFAFTPHGTTFAAPVMVTLPFDAASIAPGATPELFKTNAQNQWEPVAGATFGAASVSAPVTSFSWLQVNGLLRDAPTREWEFGAFPGDGGDEVSFGGATQIGGLLEEVASFGRGFADFPIITFTQSIPADGTARGYIFGTDDGKTYGVYAESPSSGLGSANPIGSIARLKQTQSFIKLSDDATLTFTLTRALLSTFDNGAFPAPGANDTSVKAEVYLEVQAYTDTRSFFHTAGGAIVTGTRDLWRPEVWNYGFSRAPLWSDIDFGFTVDSSPSSICPGATTSALDLKAPRTYTVDLSSIAVGEEFTLRSEAFAKADNRRGGGTPIECSDAGANAFLRDPLAIGGASVAFTGLEPTNRPLLAPPVEAPQPPATCVPGPGPDPQAGVIQFSAATFSVGEQPAATPAVKVTRTGGSRGAVSATFATSDGSAAVGSDYTAVSVTVLFADGDAAPRVVEVPIVQDQASELGETVNLTLSQPGGCAALGAQASAVLTIVDDDPVPTGPAVFSIGGTVSGLTQGQVTLVLQLPNNGSSISLGNGAFSFPLLASTGMGYAVRVGQQPPTQPPQTCVVNNGTGIVGATKVDGIEVRCS